MYTELKAQIVRRGLTQRLVARKVGCSEFRLWRLLHGRARPTGRERRRLARLLGLSQSQVFSESVEGTGKAGRPKEIPTVAPRERPKKRSGSRGKGPRAEPCAPSSLGWGIKKARAALNGTGRKGNPSCRFTPYHQSGQDSSLADPRGLAEANRRPAKRQRNARCLCGSRGAWAMGS